MSAAAMEDVVSAAAMEVDMPAAAMECDVPAAAMEVDVPAAAMEDMPAAAMDCDMSAAAMEVNVSAATPLAAMNNACGRCDAMEMTLAMAAQTLRNSPPAPSIMQVCCQLFYPS